MKKTLYSALFAAAVSVMLLAQSVSAQPIVNIMDLGIIGKPEPTMKLMGLSPAQPVCFINDLGQIAGSASLKKVDFFYRDGVFSLIDGSYMGIRSLNNNGQVAGTLNKTDLSSAFVWQDGKTITIKTPTTGTDYAGSEAVDINDLGMAACNAGLYPFYWTPEKSDGLGIKGVRVYAINNLNQIVGGGDYIMAGDSAAFIWMDGVIRLLKSPGKFSRAFNVNDNSQIVGATANELGIDEAVLWDGSGSEITYLSTLVGGDILAKTQSTAYGINNAGQIIGTISKGDIGFFCDSAKGEVKLLLSIGPEGVVPYAINDSGHVAGTISNIGAMSHAFLWTDEDGMVDLGSFERLPGDTAGIDKEESMAYGINNHGQIVGICTDKDFAYHLVVWTVDFPPPTPEAAIDETVSAVEDIQQAGAITEGEGQSMTTKLVGAKDKLDKGNTQAACNTLKAFINQTQAFMDTGKLTYIQGTTLINEATSTMNSLGCDN